MARICQQCNNPTYSTDPLCDNCGNEQRAKLHIQKLIEIAILKHLPDNLIQELREMKDDEQVAKVVYSYTSDGNKIQLCIKCGQSIIEKDLQSWYCKKCSDALSLSEMSRLDSFTRAN